MHNGQAFFVSAFQDTPSQTPTGVPPMTFIMAGGAALLGSPEPALSKIGGIALTAHGIAMVAAGRRAWRTGTASETQTERLARAAAQKAHATPAIVNLVGIAADSMLPDGIIHAAAHFGATRALRVASANANRLYFKKR
jgi:hypothetical protein